MSGREGHNAMLLQREYVMQLLGSVSGNVNVDDTTQDDRGTNIQQYEISSIKQDECNVIDSENDITNSSDNQNIRSDINSKKRHCVKSVTSHDLSHEGRPISIPSDKLINAELQPIDKAHHYIEEDKSSSKSMDEYINDNNVTSESVNPGEEECFPSPWKSVGVGFTVKNANDSSIKHVDESYHSEQLNSHLNHESNNKTLINRQNTINSHIVCKEIYGNESMDELLKRAREFSSKRVNLSETMFNTVSYNSTLSNDVLNVTDSNNEKQWTTDTGKLITNDTEQLMNKCHIVNANCITDGETATYNDNSFSKGKSTTKNSSFKKNCNRNRNNNVAESSLKNDNSFAMYSNNSSSKDLKITTPIIDSVDNCMDHSDSVTFSYSNYNLSKPLLVKDYSEYFSESDYTKGCHW